METKYKKLGNAIKLSFPVIGINTFEMSRAEEVTEELANENGKAFVVMRFKELPAKTILEKKFKKEDLEKGVVIFDPYFFDRKKVNHETMPALKSALLWMENNGINYVIASNESLSEEFVYHVELPEMSQEDIISLLKVCEENIPDFKGFEDEDRVKIANYARGLSYMQMKNVFTMSAYLSYKGQDHLLEIKKEKSYLLRDYGLEVLDPIPEDEVGGLDNVKEFLHIRKTGFEENFPSKGIILVGVQGAGKTLTSQAAGYILNTAVVRIDVTKFFSKYIGETEENFRKALSVIEQIAPVTVLIEEMDKVFGSNEGDHEVSKRLLSIFLVWLQERKEQIFIVGTANRVQSLPSELTRAGRWDKQFLVDLPNSIERRRIFEIHIGRHNIKLETEEIQDLVEKSVRYTGAEIEQSVIDALFDANYKKVGVSHAILLDTLGKVPPISETKKEDVDAIRALRHKGFYPASSISIEDETRESDENSSSRKISLGEKA